MEPNVNQPRDPSPSPEQEALNNVQNSVENAPVSNGEIASEPHTQKKVLLITLVGLVFLSIVGIGLVFLVRGSDTDSDLQKTDVTTSTQLGDSVQTRLDALQLDLNQAGADPANISAVSLYIRDDEKENTISIPSDVSASYNTENKPIFDTVTGIFTRNGLVLDEEIRDQASGDQAWYQDEVIACHLTAGGYVASANCVSKERFLRFKNEAMSVTSATEAVLGVTLGRYDVTFYENEDKTLTGAVISGTITSEEFINGTYLVNDGSGWEYIAQATQGRQAEIPPKCDEFTDEQFALFNTTQNTCPGRDNNAQ